jgi:RNA polymerase sigma-70 factor (ECF subfamily)
MVLLEASKDNDLELTRKARGGDLRAFELLMKRHQLAVYNLVTRMVGDASVAEELTQDIFLKAYYGLKLFRGEACFPAWLYRITMNHVRDYVTSRRAKNLKRETSLEGQDSNRVELATDTPAPDTRVLESELASLFTRALNGLEPHLREAFLLRHQENLDYERIAGILQISAANARIRVHRARGRILEELRTLGYDV